jgi:uncharacterized protein YecE (DUF72 family)
MLTHRRYPSRVTQAEAVGPNDAAVTLPDQNRRLFCEKLYDATCGHREVIQDVTGAVQSDARGEIEALRLYEKIIHDHPLFTSDQVDEALVNLIYTDRRRQRLHQVFDWVSERVQKLVENQPITIFSVREKHDLLDRLKTTTLQLPPPAKVYANELDLFTKLDVYYERTSPTTGTIRVGGAYVLTARSWFNRVFTFAHELAHSIDPCEMKPLKIPAYERLTSCFVKTNVIKPRKKDNQCGESDQLSEAFADWVAASITAEALNSYSGKFKNFQDVTDAVMNSVRDLCDQDGGAEQNLQAYPSARTRIGVIFSQLPAIQTLLGCENKTIPVYCSLEASQP